MAMNPMQRKIRNGFLFGFLVALIIGGVVAAMLIMKNKEAQEEMAKLQQQYQISLGEVYVSSREIKAGEAVVMECVSLPKEYIPENAITPENVGDYRMRIDDEDFEVPDDDEELDESMYNWAMVALVPISDHTIITTDFVERSTDASTYRLFEYSMISLPSKMDAGNFIDIRLTISGNDCVVLSKIKVEECTSTTIWLKLSEGQMQTLNCAILESYMIKTSKLYATLYTDDAQAPLNCTYIPDSNTINMIVANISPESKDWKDLDELSALYFENVESPVELNDENMVPFKFRADVINQALGTITDNERDSAITTGYASEKSAIQAARDSLMGSLGY